MTFVKTSIS